MSSIALTCPLDGLPLGATVVLGDRIGTDADIDGDFARNPNQHVHYPYSPGILTCLSGHRWRCVGDLVMQRVA